MNYVSFHHDLTKQASVQSLRIPIYLLKTSSLILIYEAFSMLSLHSVEREIKLQTMSHSHIN